jgi:hypothetical protein
VASVLVEWVAPPAGDLGRHLLQGLGGFGSVGRERQFLLRATSGQPSASRPRCFDISLNLLPGPFPADHYFATMWSPEWQAPPEPSTNPPLSMTTQRQRGVHRGFQQRRRLAAQLPAIQLPRPPAAQLLSPVEALADGPHTWLQGPAVQAPGQLRLFGSNPRRRVLLPSTCCSAGMAAPPSWWPPRERSWPGACTAGP